MTEVNKVALVVLPFDSEELALTFTNLVIGKMSETSRPIVCRGAAYEFDTGEEQGQVLEFHEGWEAFLHPEIDGAVVLQRTTSRTED